MNLNRLYHMEIIREIDLAFAKMIRRLDPKADSMVAVAAALVSRATNRGDVCLDLAALERNGIQHPEDPSAVPLDLSRDQWQAALNSSHLVGSPGAVAPMILDGKRLYLQRYWTYEHQVAQGVLERCAESVVPLQSRSSPGGPNLDIPRADVQQRRAVWTALNRRFTVISGGPGTGKTYTIGKIISLLQRQAQAQHLRIKLAAPTGKAAARLQEALEAALQMPGARLNATLPFATPEAQTLHRLLGAAIGRAQYRFHAKNPLPADVVIVDEASMVDMAMMARLMQALTTEARLILVGDKDQLASVEAGAVLGDICTSLGGRDDKQADLGAKDRVQGDNNPKAVDLSSPVVVLKHNYRFGQDSAIHRLGLAVNRGDGDAALALLEKGEHRRLSYCPMGIDFHLEQALAKVVVAAFEPIFAAQNPLEALGHLKSHKILTPLRKGPFGVQGLNLAVQRILRQAGMIPAFQGASPWYAGRPVMITRNDYHHHLYNGDMGITVVERVGGTPQFRVAFADDGQGVIQLSPEQLPEHETVYAMTVHKSQGTEFDNVLLVLPHEDVPILTRELIYTAITRARKKVTIWSRPMIFKSAVERRIVRASGLRKALQFVGCQNSATT